MAEGDPADARDKRERMSASVRQEELFSPFPWFDATRPYEFLLFTEEQMRMLNGWEASWTRPEVSLEDFLRRRAAGLSGALRGDTR
ncbi:MAG: hypothetical protein WCC12_16815 [Anaerolineales bacterium]